MKCIFCKGETRKEVVEDEEQGISLGKFPAQICSKCGEIYFDQETAKKIQTKSKELGLFGLAKKTRVAEVGNSLAVRIPKSIIEFIGLHKNDEVLVHPQGKKEIVISTRL